MSEVQTPEIPKTVDGLLAAATAQAGLDDFGDRHFITGLSKFIESANDDAQLNPLGEQMVYGGILNLLINRLRYVQDIKDHPEILSEKIIKPIIILGLPRTGTSKLQRVLSADPEVQRMDYWRTINPAPFPDEEPGHPKGRIEAALAVEEMLSTQFPGWMARHPTEALEPDEELHLMHGSFECMVSWLFARTPSYYDYISHCDQRPMYQHLYQQMQYLQWQDGGARGRPWIMKSPVHIRSLDVVLETFPDAVLVHCHRDLQKVIPSFASLIVEARSIASDHVDPVVVGSEMFEYWASSLGRYLIEREKLSADRIMDVQFEEITSDIVGVIAQIYERAGRELTPEAIAAFKDHEARRPEHHWGAYTYSAADYGYTQAMIEKRFTAYRQQFLNP
ncbi:MAG: sulfotransferase [Porticoccaceae bacterium]|nr:sulfotransferase [Pseudomonadales bacterium]MCP5172939.1 sulfotransferase [Pseudomonadales bacterium]MCP5302412.1 sulfotransferase [Pseudomonadales bacterium]